MTQLLRWVTGPMQERGLAISDTGKYGGEMGEVGGT